MSLWLITGLGNPPEEYRNTRHNVGYMLIDRLAEIFDKRIKDTIFSIFRSFNYKKMDFEDSKLILLKPRTYMNHSGIAIKDALEKFKVDLDKMLVIYDDVYIDLGRIRLRRSGGDGGHKGLQSIISHIGSDDFPRLKIGVGPPYENGDISRYVLSEFKGREIDKIEEVLTTSVNCIKAVINDGIEKAMMEYN
jgi:PTH1 family peptidyl-tRNA hydrolase